MAAAIETGEGVVAKSEDDAIKLDGWQNYLKYGKDYDSARPLVGQKVRVHYRPWPKPNSTAVYYYLNEVEVLGPPPETTPADPPGPGPGPVVTYQETHDAAEARVAVATPDSTNAVVSEPGAAAAAAALLEPKPGDYAFRDLSIMRQNRLNVTVQALVANLEQCPPDEKVGRMITPWKIAEFERLLVEGAADEGLREPPPEDLPG